MTALPPDVQYGYVADRVLRSVMDTPADEDHLPDAVPASGTVTLTPVDDVFAAEDGRTTIIATPYKYSISQSTGADKGLLVNPATGHTGPHAVVAGWYKVTYGVDGYTKSYGPFRIAAEHTLSNPFWIRANLPLTQTPTTKLVVTDAMLLEVRAIRDQLLGLEPGTGDPVTPAELEAAIAAYFLANPLPTPEPGTAEPFVIFDTEAQALQALADGEIPENAIVGIPQP